MLAKKSQNSGKSLVIVESPAKAKTINRYLGSSYKVMASMGHVRDLPPSEIGIDFEHDFEPVYEILTDKRKIVRDLRKAATSAKTIYLATDLDREGEAIAWHLAHALDIDIRDAKRVVFNEITKSAIKHAFANPHELDMNKVNAQQARRLLDRIVGYQLSPLLQQKIGKGLSAGRVQSVSVRLVVDREKQIRKFIPEESWRVMGCFATDPSKKDALSQSWNKFLDDTDDSKNGRTVKDRNTWLSKHSCLYAELFKINDETSRITTADDARSMAEELGFVVDTVDEQDYEQYKGFKTVVLKGKTDDGVAPTFTIKDVQQRRSTSKANPPFTTAVLQQTASTMLGFGPSRTMRISQQLYEGVDLGGKDGQTALITYMRTDSTNLSKDSIEAVRDHIQTQYGEKYIPAKPNVFGKAKRAQEAHEAIRPTDVTRTPDSLREPLTAEQYKLYDLIWRRFTACQMTPAQWDNKTILIGAQIKQGEAIFKTTGRRLVFDGFTRVMGVSENGDVILPDLQPGSEVAPLQIDPQQQFTSPPARYSEASLVKKMESEGIGRPSTYAAIIQTIQDRGYVDLIDKRLHPTSRGEVVTEKLVEHFPDIMDIKFTSHMEEELDKIEDADMEWSKVLREFYDPFKISLDKAQNDMQPIRAEPSEYTCKECGKPMVYRLGRNGRFLSCSGYPECKVSMNVDLEGKAIADVVADAPCVECGKKMILRKSRMGPFLGCTGYPECRFTLPSDDKGVPLKKVKPEDIKEKCPECKSEMAVKFSRGRSFLGCSSYPKCKTTMSIPEGLYVEKPKPIDAGARCDKCGRAMVIRTSRRGPFLSCSGFPRCRNAMPEDKIEHLRALEAEGKIPDAPPENSSNGRAKNNNLPKDKNGKVDIAALGPPPPGFAWTRTGRPVVETWPEDSLVCPDCGGEVSIKTGRFGPYFGCIRYPKCSFVSNLRGAAKKQAEIEFPSAARPKPIPTNVRCDECGETMVIRKGRSGQFLGCSKYPKCRFSQPLPEGETAESLAVAKT